MDIPRKRTMSDVLLKNKRLLMALSIFLLFIFVVAVMGFSSHSIPSGKAQSMVIDTVKLGDLNKEIHGVGILTPQNFKWLTSSSQAQVTAVLVKPGAIVTPDSVLIKLSAPEIMEAKQEADWRWADARSEYFSEELKLQSQLLDLKANFVRLESAYESKKMQVDAEFSLVDKGVISRVKFNQTKLMADGLTKQLTIEQERIEAFTRNIDLQLKNLQARINLLKDKVLARQVKVDELTIRAGISGVIQDVGVEHGQTVQVGTLLAKVADVSMLIAELKVPETLAKDILLKQEVEIDTRNGKVLGAVSRIDPRVINGTVKIDVAISEELPQGARADLSVEGLIKINRMENVLYIDRPSLAAADSFAELFVLQPDDNIAIKTKVEFGISSLNQIEVKSGLKKGDRVIISNTNKWASYQQLIIE
jgi:HlyD family secretion protein